MKTGSGVIGKFFRNEIWLESLIYDSYKWYFLMEVRFRNVPKLLNFSSFNAFVSVVVLSAFCFTFVDVFIYLSSSANPKTQKLLGHRQACSRVAETGNIFHC